MKNISEFYIIDKPIDTKIGKLYPITIKNYPELTEYIDVILLEKDDIINQFKLLTKQEKEFKPFLEIVKKITLFEFIKFCSLDEYKDTFLYDLYNKYKKLFIICFKKDVFDLIQTNEEFEYYINLIKNRNCIKYEKPNPNPEIEKFNKMKKEHEEKKNGKITFESIYTSVCVGLHKLPEEIDRLTVYQFYSIFSRIGQFKSFDISALFATVGGGEIPNWYADINMFNDNKKKTTLEDFSKNAQKIISVK